MNIMLVDFYFLSKRCVVVMSSRNKAHCFITLLICDILYSCLLIKEKLNCHFSYENILLTAIMVITICVSYFVSISESLKCLQVDICRKLLHLN